MSNLFHHLPNWWLPKWRPYNLFSIRHLSSVPGKPSGPRLSYNKAREADYADLEAARTVSKKNGYELEPEKSTDTHIEAGIARTMEEYGI